jgi:uroporphyrinogen-III decarboxylase
LLGSLVIKLDHLIEKVERQIADPKSQETRAFWKRFYALEEVDRVPIRITLTMRFFATNLGIDLVDHYEKPEKYVEDSLRILQFQHEEILDDRFKRGIVLNFGEGFESSLFGSKPTFKSDIDPLVGVPIIKTEEDFENLDYPDFYKSGLMPKIIETYEAAEKMVKGRIPVFFENWDRGPWGVAFHLRGFQNLVEDVYERPDFVRRLLAFITESRIRWEKEKERFIGKKTEYPSLYDDEVHSEILSQETYKKFVYPHEKKLAEFYPNGIFYFHSCGNITPFLDTITSIRGLRLLHISPATDFKIAAEKLGRKIVLQKRMDPLFDLDNDASTIESRIREILRIGRKSIMELDPGPIQDTPLDKVKAWISLARKVINEERGHALT